MINGFFLKKCKKRKMSSFFPNKEKGVLEPVTILKIIDNYLFEFKDLKKNGYSAFAIAIIKRQFSSEDNMKKKNFSLSKFLKKKNLAPNSSYYFKEIRVNKLKTPEIETAFEKFRETNISKLPLLLNFTDYFKVNAKVDVSSRSKGKGFQGTIKRFGHARGPMSHGSGNHRAMGSTGAIAPNRVFKQQPMPGRDGSKKVTIANLEILKISLEDKLVYLKGSIPGNAHSLVFIKQATKNKK